MAMISIPDTLPPAEQARIHAGILLCSGMAAQGVLLLKLTAWGNLLISIALLALLAIAFAAGAYVAQWPAIQRQNRLPRLRQGFLISAAGLLLLLAASRDLPHWLPMLAGILLSGLGQGMVGNAVMKGGKKAWHTGYTPGLMAILLSTGVVLAVTAALLLQTRFAGTAGFPYAFGLLLDLSLLGALYVRIIESEN